ncbi:MAG: aminoacetone oxidase family FAD-binding enzyme [Lachnospiraceae bacterium]|nr:aminoacetone oxidase family FAD-binding enzyme [Lachnospiraceae bacterium]
MIGIIGCGASGMLAAIMAAREGASVTVFEHNDRPGRKLLATGNGRCNLANEDQSEEWFRSDMPETAQAVLRHFSKNDVLDFFRGIGIPVRCKRGYWYPQCEQASAVVTALSEEMRRLNVRVMYNVDVTRIDVVKDTDGTVFNLTVKEQGGASRTVSADKLVLACGGPAGDRLGQSDFGFRTLRALGVPVTRYQPALVPLETDQDGKKDIAGVRMEVSLTLACGDTEYREKGEIVWTEYGISGIPVMQLSRFAAKALTAGDAVALKVCMIPDAGEDEIREMVISRKGNPAFTSRNAAEALCGLVPGKMSQWLMKRAGIDPAEPFTGIAKECLERYASELSGLVLTVKGLRPYAQAQTTCGGVPLSEINPDTMEIKSIPGLYVTGELLDVDGACGGYNLQWAFATGAVAGRALANTRRNA